MSTVGGDQYLSLESKETSNLTPDEERDYYRQRFLSMKLVLKELHQQLTVFKNRCAGVDSVALMLKESKHEIAKLTRQRKALETAIANLQNRLSTNGLSNSVNMEETELFVPGASKQTLDNLARENARLRTLLKSAEGQTGKKPSEDFQSMKASVEQFEAENNQLKAQLLEMENLKLHLASQYEDMIEKLKAQHKTELEQGHKQQSSVSTKGSRRQSKDITEIEKNSVATQTQEVEPTKIEKLKSDLRQMSEQCLELSEHLQNVQVTEKYDTDKFVEKNVISQVSEQAYLEVKAQLETVTLMNQRWQSHHESQTHEIHFLNAKIAELQNLCRESDAWKNEADAKEVENQKLRQDVANLSQEANRRRSQPQFDHSIVEILKQQIQVCTEDFNTERKDREQAVNRSKALEEELNRKKNEIDALKKEVENYKKSAHPVMSQLERREPQPVRQIMPNVLNSGHFRARGAQTTNQNLPFAALNTQASVSSPRLTPPHSFSMSPAPSPGPASVSSIASNKSQNSRDSGYGNLSSVAPPQGYDFMSLPKGGQDVAQGHIASPGILHPPSQSNISMPALSRKSARSDKDKEQYLTCPKCNKEFTEDEAAELVPHIDACTA